MAADPYPFPSKRRVGMSGKAGKELNKTVCSPY